MQLPQDELAFSGNQQRAIQKFHRDTRREGGSLNVDLGFSATRKLAQQGWDLGRWATVDMSFYLSTYLPRQLSRGTYATEYAPGSMYRKHVCTVFTYDAVSGSALLGQLSD